MSLKKPMSREWFESTGWRCSYEEFLKFDCGLCDNKDCPHRECFRRVPLVDGGLALCPKLHEPSEKTEG